MSAEEKQVMQAIRGRLDASAQSNTSSWAKFVSDEMITPLEGQMKSKEAWIHQHESWPHELKYWYPLEDVQDK